MAGEISEELRKTAEEVYRPIFRARVQERGYGHLDDGGILDEAIAITSRLRESKQAEQLVRNELAKRAHEYALGDA